MNLKNANKHEKNDNKKKDRKNLTQGHLGQHVKYVT